MGTEDIPQTREYPRLPPKKEGIMAVNEDGSFGAALGVRAVNRSYMTCSNLVSLKLLEGRSHIWISKVRDQASRKSTP